MSDNPKVIYESLKTIEDVQRLVDAEVRESFTLEYKEAYKQWDEEHKKKIAKCISAFANSGGGVLIFGIECDKTEEEKPVSITGVHSKNTPESFDRIATAAVRPELEGWLREPFGSGDKSALVVFVPESERAPHVSTKHNQYFHRCGAQSIAMESHLVELYYGRRRKPALNLKVVEPLRGDSQPKKGYTASFDFEIQLENLGAGISTGASVVIKFLAPWQDGYHLHETSHQGVTTEQIFEAGPVKKPFPRYHIEVERKVFPKSYRCIITFQIQFSGAWRTRWGLNPLFEWEAYADDMEPKRGVYTLSPDLLSMIQAEKIPT